MMASAVQKMKLNKLASVVVSRVATIIAKSLGKVARSCLTFTLLPSPVSILRFNRKSLRIILRGEFNIKKGVGETTNKGVKKRN